MDFKLFNTFDESLKTEWNALLENSIVHVPFLRHEYLHAWWQTRGGGEWPVDAQLAIITARQDGILVGIAPFFFTIWEGEPSLLLLGSIEISDYLDLIVRKQDLASFTSGLFAFLDSIVNEIPVWNRIDLYNVLENSPTLPALKAVSQGKGWFYKQEPFRPALTIPLPGDWELYLSGIDKKQRHEIRRKMRRAYNGDLPVRFYIVREADTLDREIDAFLALMEQDPEKARFLTPPMRETFRLTIQCAFEAGCLHLSFLEVDGQKAAGYLSFDYLDQLWVYNSGMNRTFNDYSPGWVLLGELLQWANENGRKAFDFMRGDEDYKIRFGAQQRDVMRVTISKM